MPSSIFSVGERIVLGLFVRSFVRPSGPMFLQRYLINGFSNLDETCVEYSLAPTDDLVVFWRSEVKGQDQSRLSGWRSTHVNAGC